MSIKYLGAIFLVIVLLIILYFPKMRQGFQSISNLGNLNMGAAFPECQNVPLLYKDYPVIHKNMVSDKNYNDIWWEYPIFTEGSYAQITNNIRYPNNPDNGTAIGAEFSNAFYKNKKNKSNYSKPLGPVPVGPRGSMRVGYYRTKDNLILGSSPGKMLELPAF